MLLACLLCEVSARSTNDAEVQALTTLLLAPRASMPMRAKTSAVKSRQSAPSMTMPEDPLAYVSTLLADKGTFLAERDTLYAPQAGESNLFGTFFPLACLFVILFLVFAYGFV